VKQIFPNETALWHQRGLFNSASLGHFRVNEQNNKQTNKQTKQNKTKQNKTKQNNTK